MRKVIPPQDPLGSILAIVYGGTNMGKTASLIYTFGDRAIYLGEPTAIQKIAQGLVGITIPDSRIRSNLTTFGEIARFIRQLGQARLKALEAGKPADIPPIVIDDLSIVAKQTQIDLMRRGAEQGQWVVNSAGELLGGGVFAFWREFGAALLDLRDSARWAGTHIGISAHEREPGIDKQTGRFHKGGPWLPSKTLVAEIPTLACTVLHATLAEERKPWPRNFVNDPDDYEWIGKDRHDVMVGQCPPNLRAGLTLYGYRLPYPTGLEWIGDEAAMILNEVLRGEDRAGVLARSEERKGERDPRHMYWARRDGFDQAELIQARSKRMLNW